MDHRAVARSAAAEVVPLDAARESVAFRDTDDIDTVARLEGGVWLNLGSAVVMPEVFLKAVATARNLGYPLYGMTTANLDFQQQYRGRLNVLDRPGGEGIALTGHHELLIPLLHAAVVARIAPPASGAGRRGGQPGTTS